MKLQELFENVSDLTQTPEQEIDTDTPEQEIDTDTPEQETDTDTPEQETDLTQTPEFKQWFNGSKVVDSSGKPLVVYHGTPNYGFNTFSSSNFGERDSGDFGNGFYFTPSADYAATYGKTGYWNLEGDSSKVYAVYVSIKRPLYVDVRSKKIIKGKNEGDFLEDIDTGSYDGVLAVISNYDRGLDGYGWTIKEVVAFYPNQIKSVNNNGNFSSSENINEEEEIDIPEVKVGDTIKVGKWKNKKAEVKGSKVDDDGQTILKTNKGDKRLFNFKTTNESQNIEGGLADNKTVEDIAKLHDVSVEQIESQIEIGIKVEMEHTTDEEIAKEISMDHLVEFPDYYDRLIAMEQQAEEK